MSDAKDQCLVRQVPECAVDRGHLSPRAVQRPGRRGLLLEECQKWARDNDYADTVFNRHAIYFYTRQSFERVSRVLRREYSFR